MKHAFRPGRGRLTRRRNRKAPTAITCGLRLGLSRTLLLIPIKDRQVNFHRHRVGLDVLDNSVKLSIVNVNVRNLHARILG
jgi:hypothetical protein